jgi:hypothetical protein
MNRPPRYKQDAVIIMAIIVVILALWRLQSRPKQFGGIGSWVGTNIFGPATLSLFSGSEPGADGNTPPAGSNSGPITASNGLAPIRTNTPTSSRPPVIEAPPGSHQTLSTNLLNTNGPVTVIAVTPSDLVETPPGVTSASNVLEAATIEQRLGEVSAKGGDIQISLSWNNYNDLDLHCIDPSGEEIWFSHPVSSRTGGELDVDRNAHPPYTTSPVENIYWPIGAAPPGLYKIFVVYYAPRNGMDPAVPTAFTVRTVVRGWKTWFFKSAIRYTGRQEPKPICTLQYDPANADPSRRFRFVQ